MKKLIIPTMAVLLSSSPVYAENKLHQDQFNKLDTNSDGMLTQNEIQAQPVLIRLTNFYYQYSFISADVNKDGQISLDEFLANEQDTY